MSGDWFVCILSFLGRAYRRSHSMEEGTTKASSFGYCNGVWANCPRIDYNVGPGSGLTAGSDHVITDPESAAPKLKEMYAYFEDVIEERRRNPGTDVLSRVVHAKMTATT